MSNEKIKKALIEVADEYKIPYNSCLLYTSKGGEVAHEDLP